MLFSKRIWGILAVVSVYLTGCASLTKEVRHQAPDPRAEVYDPLEGVNRPLFHLNQGVDKTIIRPVAIAYRFIIPKPLRKGVKNVSQNLQEPIFIANNMMQGDVEDAVKSSERLLVNSTAGLGGVVDIAAQNGNPVDREDFGQTLASYRIPPGPYLVLPLLGPSNMRDLVGRVGDALLDPFTWSRFEGKTELRVVTRGGEFLDARLNAEPFIRGLDKAADPYVSLREFYEQNNLSQIHEDADPIEGYIDFNGEADRLTGTQ